MLVRDVPLLGCLFRAENEFWVIIFGKMTRFLVNLKGIDFDQISLSWLEFWYPGVKFWIVVTILGYTFSTTCRFYGIVFAKSYKF